MALYSTTSYAMGAADVTPAEAAKATAALRKMRRALKGWLKFRTLNNAIAQGKAPAKVPAGYAKMLVEQGRDWAREQRMANQLHVLLSETFDGGSLPSPDVSRDPDAAVKLAQIAVSGRLPDEVASPGAQGLGFFWLWPAVVVVGLVLFTVVYKIHSDAQQAEDLEKTKCIEMGGCTDYGFWLKIGAVALIGWLAWDKFGLREAVQKRR